MTAEGVRNAVARNTGRANSNRHAAAAERLLWARMQMEQRTGAVFDSSEWKCAASTLPEMKMTSVQSIATHFAGGPNRNVWRASFTVSKIVPQNDVWRIVAVEAKCPRPLVTWVEGTTTSHPDNRPH